MSAAYDLLAEKLNARGVDVDAVEPRPCTHRTSRPRRGRTATPARASPSSRSPACRATRSRSSRTRPRCTATPASRRRSRSTSRGTASTTSQRCASTRTSSACDSARSTRTSSRSPSTSSAASATPTRRSAAARSTHLLECIEIAAADRLRRALALARRRHELRRPGLVRGAPRATRRVHCRRSSPRSRTSIELLVEYKLYEPAFYAHRPRRLGLGAPALPGARRAAEGARRPRPPRAGREHRADRLAAARRGPARRLPLQRPQVRRRRPDRRLGRSVPALPGLLRARRLPRRSSAACARRSTSRTTSSRRSRR